MVPMEVVAIGFPLASKAKIDDAGPLRRFQPMVEDATTEPLALVLRILLVMFVMARLVVVDCCKEVLPVTVKAPTTVEDACDTSPPVNVDAVELVALKYCAATAPWTLSFSDGLVLPIPTLPVLKNVMRSLRSERIAILPPVVLTYEVLLSPSQEKPIRLFSSDEKTPIVGWCGKLRASSNEIARALTSALLGSPIAMIWPKAPGLKLGILILVATNDPPGVT